MQKERKRFTSKTYDNMKDEQTTCTPCEQNFERKVNELVKEGEAPDTKQRAKKEAEVKAAFDEHGKSEK